MDDGRKREISFIVSPYLLTRVAYECKFASLRYRGCNVNRISSRLWHNGMRQLRRSPSRAKNVKEERRRDAGPVRLITLKHEHEFSSEHGTSIRAMRQAEIYDVEF